MMNEAMKLISAFKQLKINLIIPAVYNVSYQKP